MYVLLGAALPLLVSWHLELGMRRGFAKQAGLGLLQAGRPWEVYGLPFGAFLGAQVYAAVGLSLWLAMLGASRLLWSPDHFSGLCLELGRAT